MTNAWITWAYKQKGLKTGEKFVLVVLGDHADEDGYCYPSQKRMAEYTGMTTRSVQTHCENLEKKGFVKRRKAQVKDNYYRYEYDLVEQHHLVEQPENSSTGKKQQEQPENPAENNRKILPNNPYIEPSIEPPIPSFDDFEREWKKLGLTPKTEPVAKSVKVWGNLTDEQKHQAVAGCVPFQRQYRKENRFEIKMLGMFRYLDEKRFKDFCAPPKPGGDGLQIWRGEEGWNEWVDAKVREAKNHMARALYEPGGRFADEPLHVPSRYPPGTNVPPPPSPPQLDLEESVDKAKETV